MSQGPRFAQDLTEAHLKDCRVLPHREALLKHIPKGKVFCEVGVALGNFSEKIVEICRPTKFIAIDTFEIEKAPQWWSNVFHGAPPNATHFEFYKDRFKERIDRNEVVLMKGYSQDRLKDLSDKSVDIFYLDAHHSYESVAKELAIVKNKISGNGWIVFNDYIMADWTKDPAQWGLSNVAYGVVQAANEFMLSEKWEMKYFCLHGGMFCDIAIQKMA